MIRDTAMIDDVSCEEFYSRESVGTVDNVMSIDEARALLGNDVVIE